MTSFHQLNHLLAMKNSTFRIFCIGLMARGLRATVGQTMTCGVTRYAVDILLYSSINN